MTRGIILGVIAMATIVVASNILVQFFVGNWLTWGAFTYPFAFLVTDVINRLYGVGSARKVIVAQMIDVLVFDRLREGTWWRAPLASTLVGSTIDTILFFTIAFSASMSGLLGTDHNTDFFNEVVGSPLGGSDGVRWVGTAIVDWSVKIAIALIALVPFRILINKWQSTYA